MKKKYKKLKKSINWLIELKFIPLQFQSFLCGLIELISGFIMLGFAVVFSIQGHYIFEEEIHGNFAQLPPNLIIFLFFILGISQLVAALFQSSRSNIISGCLLLWSSLIWGLIAGAFIADNPTVLIGLSSIILAILCGLAGNSLIKHTKRTETAKETI